MRVTDPAAPTCRGAGGRRRSRRASPARPRARAYMTITRSAMSATTPRSWVTKITPLSHSWLSCFDLARGSAPGSSRRARSWARRRSARSATGDSAIAIIARWRIPPENSCGKARARSRARGIPTRLHQLDGAVERRRLGDVLVGADLLDDLVADPVTGLSDEIGSWKIIAISLPRIRSSSSSDAVTSSRSPSLAEPPKRELGAAGEPHQRHHRHRLARARLADDRHHLASVERERDARRRRARRRPRLRTTTCRSSTSSRRSAISR